MTFLRRHRTASDASPEAREAFAMTSEDFGRQFHQKYFQNKNEKHSVFPVFCLRCFPLILQLCPEALIFACFRPDRCDKHVDRILLMMITLRQKPREPFAMVMDDEKVINDPEQKHRWLRTLLVLLLLLTGRTDARERKGECFHKVFIPMMLFRKQDYIISIILSIYMSFRPCLRPSEIPRSWIA